MSVRDEIVSRIEAAIPGVTIELSDMTGTNDHWSAVIVSETFNGQSRLNRQRAVYAALGDMMAGPIHALALETKTPNEQENT